MKEKLNQIRKPDYRLSKKRKFINSLLILIFGIIMGIFAKWLDNLSIDDSIAWQHFIGSIDLRNVLSEMTIWIFIAINLSIFSKTPLRASLNVFLFFLGMTVSYHLYTICFSGFNPQRYMMIWYLVTIISPLLAFLCWYSKSKSVISMLISALILSIMMSLSLNIGFWYISLSRIIYLVMLVATIITLHVNIKNTIFSLILGFILSFFMPNIILAIYNFL